MTANAKHKIGILAYGSLIDDPGFEIAEATIETKTDLLTPFNVEFARLSKGRAGAPTLVPVTGCGAPVQARVFVVNVPESEAADRLYRREIHAVGSGRKYVRPQQQSQNTVFIELLTDFANVGIVLYTKIAATMPDPDAITLAKAAIASARELCNGKDGITYLMRAKTNGIATPLLASYETEILRMLGASDLLDAIRKAQQ